MKIVIVVMAAISMSGCGLQRVTVPNETPASTVEAVRKFQFQLSPEQKIGLLRSEAKKRGLKWRIYCGGSEKFTGWAVRKGDPWAVYDDEGAGASWWVFDRNTQGDAAFDLYQQIQGDPDKPLHHKPVESEHEHKICPPELRGE